MNALRMLFGICLIAAAFAVGAGTGKAGYVDQLEILNTYDAYGGVSFGDVGPYQVVVGIVHGKLDPTHPANAAIVDLSLAPRDSDGLVEYSTDLVILRPKFVANAKRVLFYDVVNRGNKIAAGTFNGAGANFGPGQQGNALLLRLGYTLVWSGWQGDVAQTGRGDLAAVGTKFPIAENRDGTPITGQSREEVVPDALGMYPGPGGTVTFGLTYSPTTLDKSQVTFNWRPTWKTAQGMQFSSPSTPVPAGNWSYVNNGARVQFSLPAGADPGSIFTFIYGAKNPIVMGIGFAAIRDVITFLKFDQHDRQGNLNPLNDFQHAPCIGDIPGRCHRDGNPNFEVVIMEGISQSGRYTRDFLWQGFNDDTRGREVFNGMFPIIPGSRKTFTNFRWAQPGRWSKEHEDHWQPGDQFPFAYNVISDPRSGRTDGILAKCQSTGTCPKIVHLDGGYETFGARGALVSTDGSGNDLAIPENVRLYVVPGANHGGGGGVAALSQLPQCQYLASAVVQSTIDRALAPVLVDWVANGTDPPASRWPSVANGTAAQAANQAAVGFPNLSGIGVQYRGDLYNELSVTDYSAAIPAPDVSKKYPALVSRTDLDGNEIAGIRVPDVAVPLATYTSWNVRKAGFTPGESCYYQASTLPFASTLAARLAAGDPRPSLQERYSGKADYVSKVGAAAEALVAERLLLAEDVAVYVNAAQSQTLLP